MRKGCKWPWKKASFPSKPPLHGLTFVTDKWLSPLPKVRHCVRSSDTESICGRHHQLLKLARSISTIWITSKLLLREPNHRHLLSMQINLLIPMLHEILHVFKLNFASGLKPTLAARNKPLSYWGLCTVVQYQHNLVCYWYVFNNRGRKDYSSQYLSSRTK